jgi:microcin C transport system ATP-binding protein
VTERILEVSDLGVAFHGKRVVHGINFHIDRGETLALVGESGSGKSVTALSILQLLPYPQVSHPTGSIVLDDVEMMSANKATLLKMRGDRVSMIFQEPMTSLNPLHTIERQVGEVLFVHQKLGRKAIRARTLELLQLVGLQRAQERLKAYPHELSGGQRQRVMIAMALANEPDLLIADEPTTALDITIQAQILTLLKDLQTRLNMALLLITHDLGIVRKIADRVAVMSEGSIVESAPCETVFEAPTHAYTRALLTAMPKANPVTARNDARPLLNVKRLAVHYPLATGLLAKKRVLKAVDDVSIMVKAGHTIGVVGESGSGKTTLGMAVLRLIRSQGEIRFDDTNLHGLGNKALKPYRSRMQIVFQDPYGSLSPRRSVQQIIEQGLLVHQPQLDRGSRTALVDEALIEVGLDPADGDRYPHEFSGGQRQRIAIARAIVLRPEFVVLDEPTSALDMSVQAQVVDLLRDLQERHGLSYLFISHDLKVVRALADELIVMKDGAIVEQGRASDIFTYPQQAYTKALMAAAFDVAVVDAQFVS